MNVLLKMSQAITSNMTLFVVIKPSAAMSYGDNFGVVIYPRKIKFSTGFSTHHISTNDLICGKINVVSYTDLTISGQTVEANSEKTPVIGINLMDGAGKNETIDAITVTFRNQSGSIPTMKFIIPHISNSTICFS